MKVPPFVGKLDMAAVEIDNGRPTVWAMTFSANGGYLVSGDDTAVRVRRVVDGVEVGTMAAQDVRTIAISKDSKWIVAGTEPGKIIVWDTHTYERVFTHQRSDGVIRAVDFSPDSTRLVASWSCTATVWDFLAGKQVTRPLHHQHEVTAAKYSPQGDRIATCANPGSVRVYDTNNGDLLLDILTDGTTIDNAGLMWSHDGEYLLVVSDHRIKQVQVSSSVVEVLPVYDCQDSTTSIILSNHEELIACSSNRTVKFIDISTGKLGQIVRHDQDIHSIALSLDRFLATYTGGGKITIRALRDSSSSLSFSVGNRIQGPFMLVGGTVLHSWNQGQLEKTEALLTEEIAFEHLNHRALAYRSLVRTRTRQFDAAYDDAQKSIHIQPSVIGFIAKAVALVSNGKRQEGYRACDFAFKYCHSDRMDTLLAIKAVIVCIAGEYSDAISRVGDLVATTQDDPVYHTIQAYMHFLMGSSHMEHQKYEDAIQSFKHAQTLQMRRHPSRRLWTVSLIFGWQFNDLGIRIERCLCEALYTAGHTKEAEEALLEVTDKVTDITIMSQPMIEWTSSFIERCLSTPETSADATPTASQEEQPTKPASLSFVGPSTRMLLVAEWVRMKIGYNSWESVLVAAASFRVPRLMIYRATCEHLEADDRLTVAADCFRQMLNELDIKHVEAKSGWVQEFKHRCSQKLENRGDIAMKAQQHEDAILQYSAALALDSTSLLVLLAKRSQAYVAKGMSKEALDDANEMINLDPSSPFGYERKHAALHGAGLYRDAIATFEMMLSKMSHSSDPEIRRCSPQYVRPEETRETIRMTVQDAIRGLPRVLIQTTSGRLFNKFEQAAVFESSPVFTELVSSMTTNIDNDRIQRKVAQFYRYAAFSHTWEECEPLFGHVVHVSVYDLKESFTHGKLQMFCNVARDSGFNWAWSDNCCINKQDHVTLQEALVAMFKWYEGCALVIVFLRGIRSPSKRGDLMRSRWNTRAWTFQEYHAAKVVRFYTEDWIPYMNLDLPNHKESPEIIAEMEEATGMSAQALTELSPGLNNIREKLALASRREATFVEDIAYSLFGIFSVSLPVVYGEGDEALGRLLAHLLASSGDTSILAWTGTSGRFNSCLPADITVFDHSPTSHIPSAPSGLQVQPSSLNVAAVMRLYDQLINLPVPSQSGKRIKLPCIAFKMGRPKRTSPTVFRAKADALGTVEITTKEDLSQLQSAYLIHPWIDFLLDRQPAWTEENPLPEGDRVLSDVPPLFNPNSTSISQWRPGVIARLGRSLVPRSARPIHDASSFLSSPSLMSLPRKQQDARQFAALLRQPFGALLVTPTPHVAAYRRVATDCTITVQIQKGVGFDDLIPNVRMLDVL